MSVWEWQKIQTLPWEITDIHIYFRRWAHNMIISMATYRQQLQDVATKLADIRRSL